MYEGLRALVAGAGSIGRRHARNLSTLGVAVAVADPDETARATASEEFGVETYTSIEDGLNTAPDFVVVCAPNRFHVEIATAGAKAGCHLFVEKPLSHTLDSLSELTAAVTANELTTLVGCNMRFVPELRKIRELLDDSVVGPVRAARVEGGSYLPDWYPDKDYRDAYSARADLGGGVILDYIHEINYSRWLFGEFETVSAMTGQVSHLDIETNDVAGILARRSDGMVCEFHLDYVQREPSRSCHIVGDEGTIRWSWTDGTLEWSLADNQRRSFERPDDWEVNDMYVDEMKHFLDCVVAGTHTTCPISCGRHDLELALAARESSETGSHVDL
jgi:predicted dehydrogenase